MVLRNKVKNDPGMENIDDSSEEEEYISESDTEWKPDLKDLDKEERDI